MTAQDSNPTDSAWHARAWLLAALGAVAGWSLWAVTSIAIDNADIFAPEQRWRVTISLMIFALAGGFIFTMERRRWQWSLGFAVLWAGLLGLVDLLSDSAKYYHVLPVAVAAVAAVVSIPIFQVWRDGAEDWRTWRRWTTWRTLSLSGLQRHIWDDAILFAAAPAIAGGSFLAFVLIGEMFSLIGLDLPKELLQEDWVIVSLIGGVAAGAVGFFRDRARWVAVVRSLLISLLSIFAPLLALAVSLFLLSIVGTGLQPLWDSGFSAVWLMLAMAGFAVLLINAVVGDSLGEAKDSADVTQWRTTHAILRRAAMVLAVVVTPMVAIAALSLGVRVGSYGWTPTRIWAAIIIALAFAYGLLALWSVVRGRGDFVARLLPLQRSYGLRLVPIGLVLSFFLALSVLDFEEISAQNQAARLQSGQVAVEEFDWRAMAFDFGASGRRHLDRMVQSDDEDIIRAARAALESYQLDSFDDNIREALWPEWDAAMVRVLPAEQPLPETIATMLSKEILCRQRYCAAAWSAEDEILVIKLAPTLRQYRIATYRREHDGRWLAAGIPYSLPIDENTAVPDNISDAKLDLQPVARRQLYIDDKPLR